MKIIATYKNAERHRSQRAVGDEMSRNERFILVFLQVCLLMLILLFGCSTPKMHPMATSTAKPSDWKKIIRPGAILSNQNQLANGGRTPTEWAAKLTNSPYAEYDGALISSIENHWYALIDQESPPITNVEGGKVVLQ